MDEEEGDEENLKALLPHGQLIVIRCEIQSMELEIIWSQDQYLKISEI